jgi:hypothetical protein
MSAGPARSFRLLAAAIVVAAVIIGSTLFVALVNVSTVTKTVSENTTTTETKTVSENTTTTEMNTSTTYAFVTSSSKCLTSPGQPQGAFFRVLYDSNSTPVVGASVTAAGNVALCPGQPIVQETFTTNDTEWYSLNTLNIESYLITVSYLGHDYNLTMPLGLSDFNCGTLYVPSGETNTTSSPSPCTTSPETPVVLTTSNGNWKFEVQLSSVVVSVGQQISYTCYLTNISGQNQTVVLANPISNPSLYDSAGKQVWGYEPSAETNAVQVVPAGEVFSLTLNIPTSGLQAGQTYVLSSSPNISTDANPEVPFGQNLVLNATIQVVAG